MTPSFALHRTGLPFRKSELERNWAELRSEIGPELNQHLSRIKRNPTAAPIGNFDELNILAKGGYSVHLVNFDSSSLFEGLYIPGNACDQLLINPCRESLRFRLYGQTFKDSDFSHPERLQLGEVRTLAEGECIFVGEDTLIARPEGSLAGGVFLALRSEPMLPYAWMYDAATLEPSYAVCVDPDVTQTLFILRTLTAIGTSLPTSLEKSLLEHADFSIRWAVAHHLLRHVPERAIGVLQRLAANDEDLSLRAKKLLKMLYEMRKN